LERLYNLLFEISNDYRHRVLLLLKEKPMRITDLSRQLRLTTQEISRHVSRLGEVGLTFKNVNGFYHLSPYGKSILIILEEFLFLSKNSEYFVTHSIDHLDRDYVKRIGELSGSIYTENVMSFLHFVENIIDDAEEYVWLQVDQFPLTVLGAIVESLKRGVQFKIIENEEMVSGPRLNLESMEEIQALARTRSTPLTEQRMIDNSDFFMFLSEDRCAIAFPTSEGKYDYMGFTARDERSLRWCRDLFQYNWNRAEQSIPLSPKEHVSVQRRPKLVGTRHRKIVVEGLDDPFLDAITVQEAVDNNEEVIMRGTFNLGTSSIMIRKSVVIKGEGREDDVPLTKVYKKGWSFPFTEWDYIFCVDGEGANVTIENIHFTDFNCSCILGLYGNRLNIENNMITLFTGYGRGWRFGSYGDVVLGIWIDTPFEHMHKRIRFMDGVEIRGNHLDFAYGSASPLASYVPIGPSEKDPEYRPDLFNHESYMGIGINVLNVSGKAVIENNTVRNMNARGICAQDNYAIAEVYIRHNVVESDVYGCYPFFGPDAGFGIAAQSAFLFPRSSFNIVIEDNVIELNKPNYSGIGVYGPTIDREGVAKLCGGSVWNNKIHLKDGHVGIHIRKSDGFEVSENTISGRAYYGIQVSGRRKSGELDLRAIDNVVEDNDMKGLDLKIPDEYSDGHIDGRMFTGSEGKSSTAHVWLNAFSKDNVIRVRADETVIDEGEDNKITYVNNE
jgi:predicted transcriptional regulator